MRYLGGKGSLSRHIAVLRSVYYADQRTSYIEPFIGSAVISAALADLPRRYASDANGDLVLLWQALLEGWQPPETISEEEYKALRIAPASPLRSFAGFGCSWGGKFFGGYARGEGRSYAGESKRALLKTAANLQFVSFRHCDYASWHPSNALIYCDPPYIGTTEYKGVSGFDHDRFWSCVREWSKNNTVVVSEYQAPEDFVCVWSKNVRLSVRSNNNAEPRVEKLFMLGAHDQQGQLTLL